MSLPYLQPNTYLLYDQDHGKFHNDVWTSKDGNKWYQVTKHAQWEVRQGHSAVVVGDDTMVVMGGTGC